jgi:radical SAM superfamily enzyme
VKPIICPCGTEKVTVKGYVRCPHCDDLCPDKSGCILCGTYSTATNKRVVSEYAAERQAKLWPGKTHG